MIIAEDNPSTQGHGESIQDRSHCKTAFAHTLHPTPRLPETDFFFLFFLKKKGTPRCRRWPRWPSKWLSRKTIPEPKMADMKAKSLAWVSIHESLGSHNLIIYSDSWPHFFCASPATRCCPFTGPIVHHVSMPNIPSSLHIPRSSNTTLRHYPFACFWGLGFCVFFW